MGTEARGSFRNFVFQISEIKLLSNNKRRRKHVINLGAAQYATSLCTTDEGTQTVASRQCHALSAYKFKGYTA
jgi:hypothetical protein